jgi:hypothetical protein
MTGLLRGLDEVINSVNVLCGTKDRQDSVMLWFARLHRTLQQQFVSVVILPVLWQLAIQAREGYYDGRNEAAVRLAVKMLSAVEDEDTYLPLV